MSDQLEEFSPEGWTGKASTMDYDGKVPAKGTYIFPVAVRGAEFVNVNKSGKTAFISLKLNVFKLEGKPTDGDQFDGLPIDVPVWLSPKSEMYTMWFLRKFGYKEELLSLGDGNPPVLRLSEIVGLKGVMAIEINENENTGFLQFNAKAYARLTDDLAKFHAAVFKGGAGNVTDESTIDIHDDVEPGSHEESPFPED
jgi:hypothetical protein